MLREKVAIEVQDLNHLNWAIDQEVKRIEAWGHVQERQNAFAKKLKSQQQFNNQLAAQYQQQTDGIMRAAMGKGGGAGMDQKNDQAG